MTFFFGCLDQIEITWVPQTQSSNSKLALNEHCYTRQWKKSKYPVSKTSDNQKQWGHIISNPIQKYHHCTIATTWVITSKRYPAILWLAVTLLSPPSLPGSSTRPLTSQCSTAVCLWKQTKMNTNGTCPGLLTAWNIRDKNPRSCNV